MKALGAVRLGLAIAGVLLAGAVFAQGPGGGPGPGAGFGEHRPPVEKAFGPRSGRGHWWNNPRMVEKLKLTDEQRKAFDGILLEHRKRLIDLRASLAKAELTLEPLMREDQPNEAAILAQIDKVAQARAELEKANAAFLLAIRARLTPEQWKLVQAERANHTQQRGGWQQRGQGRGGQGQGGQYRRHLPPPHPAPPPAEPPAPVAPATGTGQ